MVVIVNGGQGAASQASLVEAARVATLSTRRLVRSGHGALLLGSVEPGRSLAMIDGTSEARGRAAYRPSIGHGPAIVTTCALMMPTGLDEGPTQTYRVRKIATR